jgi:hypothetical protein
MAIEGKIPSSGPISFGSARDNLGDDAIPVVDLTVELDRRILGFYRTHLLREPDEAGSLYYQSLLGNDAGDQFSHTNSINTIDEIEQFFINSAEGQIVAATGAPAPSGYVSDYNMNRDMFRVITKSNSITSISASQLRTKDNSYTGYRPNYLLDIFDVTSDAALNVSNKLFLTDYFGGDQFVAGDTIKVTTWGHRFSNPDVPDVNDTFGRSVRFSTSYLSVVNHFIQIGTYYESPGVKNHNGGSKFTYHIVYYDPADQSLRLQTLFTGKNAREAWSSLIRIEYIPYQIAQNFYQYYYDGYEDFEAKYD